MKLSTTLLAILITLGWITTSKAQLITWQNFGSASSPGSYSSPITLTVAGPLILQLGAEFNTDVDISNQPPSAPNITIQIDQQTPVILPAEAFVVTQHNTGGSNGQVYSTDISTLIHTFPSLAAGNHTIKFTFPPYFDTGAGIPSGIPLISGGYSIIAPNEPPSGLAAAVSGLQSSIDAIQTNEAADANEISILQANQGANAAAISALQTAETNDAAVIATLQSQLTAAQNTLQTKIDSNTAAITALQNSVTANETLATQLQSQITDLQNQSGDNSTALTTLQQQQAATAAQQQTDEAALATLQSQQADIQSTLANLSVQIANDEAAQAAENATLQNQINTLKNGSSSVIGLQNQISSMNSSNRLTRNLTYAGLGLGVAGIGTGIGAILFDDPNGESGDSSSSSDTSTVIKTTNGNP